jgi:uncharacterized protein with PIN domain
VHQVGTSAWRDWLVDARLPPAVAASQERVMHCAGCDRIYWEGSHYARMRAALRRMLA